MQKHIYLNCAKESDFRNNRSSRLIRKLYERLEEFANECSKIPGLNGTQIHECLTAHHSLLNFCKHLGVRVHSYPPGIGNRYISQLEGQVQCQIYLRSITEKSINYWKIYSLSWSISMAVGWILNLARVFLLVCVGPILLLEVRLR